MHEHFGYVMATKLLVNTKAQVGYLYREVPDSESDSGWRMFIGNESIEYVNDPNNIGIYDIKTILQNDNAIASVLDRPIGTALIRSNDNIFVDAN